MVRTQRRKKKNLYIAAWEPVWNAKPKDSKGRRAPGRVYDCNLCEASKDDRPKKRGCRSDKPGKAIPYGKQRIMSKRCPMSYRRFANEQSSAIFEAASDYDSQNVTGWPDEYAGAITEGVRWYLGHRAGAMEARRE